MTGIIETEKRRRARHVIFLGAGASKTSGYPLGEDLRLTLSSTERFLAEVKSKTSIDESTEVALRSYLGNFTEEIGFFREGGFASVDEFSRLASDKNRAHAQEMKKLIQLALGLHNPEDEFYKSDYYGFIQRLFKGDDLHTLKENTTILSYNYDCYLDFLLLRAFSRRQALAGVRAVSQEWRNKLTSGFDLMTDQNWANDSDGFQYYKLHGSIGYHLGSHDYPLQMLFKRSAKDRLSRLASGDALLVSPPVVFPWEIFGDAGRFVAEANFIFLKGATGQQENNARSLYRLYNRIWERSREAVASATKISFVGLSAHEYMFSGLRYLFEDKEGEVQVVVANPDNKDFQDAKNRLHPGSLCGRMANILAGVAPGLKYTKSLSEDDGVLRMSEFENAKAGVWVPDITPRYSFKEFIQREMD